MPYAVTLPLDSSSADAVRGLWNALSAAGFANHAAALGYVPHLTLAVLPDATDAERLTDAVRHVTADWQPLPLPLSAVAAFTGDPATLWLVPTVSAPLLARHAVLCAALPAVHPYYRTAAWVPHVTLADDVAAAAIGDGISLVAEVFRPFTATLDRIDVLHFRPIAILWQARLVMCDTQP